MLQKYFPIIGEVNSPLVALQALGFTAASAEVAIKGISNEVLEALLWASVEETETFKKEVAVSVSELETARRAASKTVRYYRYRAAMAARNARSVSKLANRIKAVKKPITSKSSLKGLSGLTIEACRQKAAENQGAVRVAANNFSAAHEAVTIAIQGGDARAIRAKVAALKEATRLLEVRQLELRFAREMLSIALARHSA